MKKLKKLKKNIRSLNLIWDYEEVQESTWLSWEPEPKFIDAKKYVTRKSKDSVPPERGDELGPLAASYDHH